MPDGDEFDPGRWEAADGAAPMPGTTKRPPRPRRTERFLRGPVPWRWLQRAMALPGKALAVGLILWHLRGMAGRRTVTFCLARAAADGIPTTTARRAVRALERAGLVAICRKPGRGLEVTLLDAPVAGGGCCD
jgi:hypothetical protein